ncbi:histidine ammonia-lyase [Aquibaculum sediminis]|uniref:histidine ammonia-lyase n=1 Tax=Aquibaculum sediminis TaxID=3231907 RepID=UPI003F646096
MDETFLLRPGTLSMADLHAFWRRSRPVELDTAARPGIAAAAETVAQIVAEGRRVYGISTGFGSLARESIPREQVAELQRRLVRSHQAGVGDPLPERVVRLILLLKLGSLGRGHSGVRLETVDRLLALLNADALPVIPAQGSVGASGDLAPLAALAAPLMGEGELLLYGRRLPAAEALAELSLEPLELAAKEGLALLNGSQVSCALALDGLFRGLDVFAAAIVGGAMTTDAALGSDAPFDARIHAIRGHPGQIAVAGWLRELLTGSAIRGSHLECDRVQDPYSLRCQPQVMGAAWDLLGQAAAMLSREANAVSDNPLVFPDSGEILSGGNFHAEPVAMAADIIAIALAETVSLAERRIALLTDANFSNLPPFLVAEPGLNSGFMIAQVTAAALASEVKLRAHPASIDSLPTSANQEDHVSMATHGARRLGPLSQDAGRVLAVELLSAAQGLDLRAPLTTSPRLDEAHALIREQVPMLREDRPLTPDIEAVWALVEGGRFFELLWQSETADPFVAH